MAHKIRLTAYTHRELLNAGFIQSSDNKYLYGHPNTYMGSNMVISTPRQQKWLCNTLTHRVNGPAIIYDNGAYGFLRFNYYHRFDGPALLMGDDLREENWVMFKRQINKDKYLSWLDEMGIDINNISDNDKILIEMAVEKFAI